MNKWKEVRRIKNDTTRILRAFLLVFLTGAMVWESDTSFVSQKEYEWEWVIEPGSYEYVCFIADDFVAAEKTNGMWEIINVSEGNVLPGEYEAVGLCRDNLINIKRGGLWGYIDESGNSVIKEQFEDAYEFQENLAAVKSEHLWGFINCLGERVIENQYDDVTSFREGMVAIKQNGKWGFINAEGGVVVGCIFDSVRSFSEGLAAVEQNGKWGCINASGKIVVECVYDNLQDFSEGMAAVKQDEKWGFINQNGNIQIPLQFREVGNFSEGLAAVERNGKWAYIDKNNNIVIDYYFYDAGSDAGTVWVGAFHDGLAMVSRGTYCLIDDSGTKVFEDSDFFLTIADYDIARDLITGYVYIDEAMKVKKYGLVGMDGSCRLEPVFDYISGIYEEYVLVSQYMENGTLKDGVIRLI